MPELTRSDRWVGPNAGVPEGMPVPATREAMARANRKASLSGARPARGDGWRLTVEDQQVLAALTRYSVLTWRQVCAAFYGGVDRTTNRRVGYLREAGLVKASRNDEWAGRVLMATRAGVRLVKESLLVPLSAPQQHPGERLLHRLAVADAGLRFEARGGSTRVVTEREIRTAEASRVDAAHLAASLGSPAREPVRDERGHQRWFAVPVGAVEVHYPDLIVGTAEGLTAIEVEVAVKDRARMRAILRGYRDAAMFDQVLWLATPQVMTLLHGYRDPQGQWRDGVLHELGLMHGEPGQPGWQLHPTLRVAAFHARDPGVAYRLDMRGVPQTWWVSKSEWEQLRVRWDSDTEWGKPAGVPFLRWWQSRMKMN